MNWKRLCQLGLELPETVEDIWFRTPALKVRGKAFCRLKEDGVTVVFMTESVDEQEALCEAMPAVYHITDHYRGYAAVLARLGALQTAEARLRLERAWRTKAPKRLVATLASPMAAPPAPPAHARTRSPAATSTRAKPRR